MFYRLNIIVTLFLVSTSITFTQYMLVEPQWCYFLEKQPSCLATGDLNNDGMSEIAVGLYSNQVLTLSPDGRKLWEITTPGIPNFLVIQDIDDDSSPEIIIACFPYIAIVNKYGVLERQISLPLQGKQIYSFEVVQHTNQTKEFIVLLEGLIVILSPSGKIRATIPVDIQAFKMKTYDIDETKEKRILVLSNFSIECFTTEGKPKWNYKPEISFKRGKSAFIQFISKKLDTTTIRPFPRNAQKPIKNPWRDIEPVDAGYLSSESNKAIITGFYTEDSTGRISTNVVCLDAQDGSFKWITRVPHLLLSLKIIDGFVYVAGGYRDGDNRSGYFITLENTGIIKKILSYDWPTYFIRNGDNFILHCERGYGVRGYLNPTHEGILNQCYGAVSAYFFETGDFNGDGYTDLTLVFRSLEYPGKYRIDIHLNKIPALKKTGDDALSSYKIFLKQGETRDAMNIVEKAERYYAAIGKRDDAIKEKWKIDQEVYEYRRANLIRKATWMSLFAAAIGILLYTQRRKLKMYFHKAKFIIINEELKPTVELLESVNAFIHESIKKVNMLKLALLEIQHGKPIAEMIRFYNDNLQVLNKTYKEYEEHLTKYEQIKGRDPKSLRKLIEKIPYLDERKLDEQSSELIRSSVETLLDRIGVNLRQEIMTYRHSISDALKEAVENIRKEKYHEMDKFKIQIELSIEDIVNIKDIYYTNFEKWKLILTNMFRNAIEATVIAIENSANLQEERRIISAKLREVFEERTKRIIEIEDHGCGMDEYVRANIFKNGFSSGKKKGMGQGLTPDLEQFILSKGQYSIKSEKNVGTLIKIEMESV
ncbi:MAG: hypothetical protein QME58_04060 [Bacteroidota bacterium]|nr:hypothetical protein [Bacteroidota bacterium]